MALPLPRLPGPSPFISAEPVAELEVAPVFDVVLVDCEAVVLWLVVAFGLMVTLLCGIALKVASVFTVVLALGLTLWPALVLVVLRALLAVLPLFVPVPLVVLPAVVPLVVLVDCVADVV